MLQITKIPHKELKKTKYHIKGSTPILFRDNLFDKNIFTNSVYVEYEFDKIFKIDQITLDNIIYLIEDSNEEFTRKYDTIKWKTILNYSDGVYTLAIRVPQSVSVSNIKPIQRMKKLSKINENIEL